MTDAMTSIILPWLQAFAAALIPILGTMALGWMRQRNLNTAMVEAIARAGGEAYRHLASSGRPVTDTRAVTAAAEAGARYLLDRVPDTMRALGVSPEDAAQLAGAELGKLLAVDPSVRVGS